ncbi:hypothetical protein D1007_35109 [Hordeum vulgare]|nr:hypothetical protein D1007_35109 [Hordeum vulgare]
MPKASKVVPTSNPNIPHDDDVDDNEDGDNDKESDNIASLKIKGEMIFKALHKINIARSNFMEIMSIAIEGKKYNQELDAHLEEHEATIDTMEGHERDYANEIAVLSQDLENEQTTKESLEETFSLELSRLNESHDRALEVRHHCSRRCMEWLATAATWNCLSTLLTCDAAAWNRLSTVSTSLAVAWNRLSTVSTTLAAAWIDLSILRSSRTSPA